MNTTSSWSLKDAGRVYLDHNATTPPLNSIIEKVPEWLAKWGNPSSIHWSGRGPKNIIRDSRLTLAQFIGCHPLEIIFTGSGSEGNNLVIRGFFEAVSKQSSKIVRNEFITSSVEHPSVMACFDFIRAQGGIVHTVPVNRDGYLDMNIYKQFLSERTALVSIMAANNETGNLFSIKELAAMAHAVGAKFHSDCVQALGKIAVNVTELGVDFATFASHKMYSLKGSGLVFARKGERISSLILGGGQERGRRAGTENVLAIAAFAHAAKEHGTRVGEHAERMRRLRDLFEQDVLSSISNVSVVGQAAPRLPNTSCLVIDHVDGESLLMNLDLEGMAVSTGAACSSGNPEPSPVLLAMGLTRLEAQGSLRVSIGYDTTEAELAQFVVALKMVVARLRAIHTSSEASYG